MVTVATSIQLSTGGLNKRIHEIKYIIAIMKEVKDLKERNLIDIFPAVGLATWTKIVWDLF